MKKIIALLLATLMLVSFAACTNTDDSASQTGSQDTGSVSEEATTVGQSLLKEFKANNSGSTQEIAERLMGHQLIQFMGAAMPIEEGLLSGFDNTEIKGFKEGTMFAPMMSSIAFVGYIFELEEGADVEAFKTTLKDSANLRWNICVEAEELIVENEGNKVFFLMCPKSFEQPEADGGVGDMGLGTEDMIPAEDGITLE